MVFGKKVLSRLEEAGTALETFMLVAMLSTMMLVAVGQIIMREVFSSGFGWADELIRTKVKYVTQVPLVYTFGFMAIDKKSFEKISDGDKAIVRDVMAATYRKFDKSNLVDNKRWWAQRQ